MYKSLRALYAIAKLRQFVLFSSFVVELLSSLPLNFPTKKLTGKPPNIATRAGVNAMLTTNRPIGCFVDSRMAITRTPLHVSV